MDRTRILTAVIALSLVFTITLGGCATTTKGKEQTKGAAIGAVIGGVVGAGLGFLVGGPRGAIYGAGAGMALGGVTGYAYASSVYEKIQSAKNKANALDEAIKRSASDVAALQKNVDTMQETNRKLDIQTSNLAAAYKSKQISAKDLGKEQASMEKILADSRQSLEHQQKELAYLENTARPAGKAYGNAEQQKQVEDQIEALKKQNAEMEKIIQEQANYSQRVMG